MIEKQVKILIRDHLLLDDEDENGDVKLDLYSLDNDVRFAEDLECDSLDIADIVTKCEEEWDIKFSEDDIKSLKTIEDLVNIVELLISKK